MYESDKSALNKKIPVKEQSLNKNILLNVIDLADETNSCISKNPKECRKSLIANKPEKCRKDKTFSMDNFNLSNESSSNVSEGSPESTLSNLLLEKFETTKNLTDPSCENKKIDKREKVIKCKQCSLTFSQKNHFNRHMKGHNRNNCTICNAHFPKRKALCKHLKAEHNIVEPETMYTCSFCNKQLSKKSSYMKHLKSHANGQHFCFKCGFMCNEEIVYTEHMNDHTKVADHKCTLCGKQFVRKQQFDQHMLGHKKHSCSQCNVTVSTKKLLLKHKKDAHGVLPTVASKSFRCPLCEKCFFRAQHLRMHMSVHTGEKPVRCYECDKSFRSNRRLTKHKQSVRHLQRVNTEDGKIVEIERPYLCMKCGAKFYSQHSLSRHTEMSHYPFEAFKCNDCAYSSKCKANLKRHMESHSDVKRFICEVCGLSFRAHATLKDHHALVHSERRSFTCNLCQKSFKSKSILRRHIKNHSEARPYKCHCNSDFKRLSHLKRHLTSARHTNKDESQKNIVISHSSPRSDFSVESHDSPVAFFLLSASDSKLDISVMNDHQLLQGTSSADDLFLQVPSSSMQNLVVKNEMSNSDLNSLESLVTVTTSETSLCLEADDDPVSPPASFDDPNLNLSPSNFCNFNLQSSPILMDNIVSDIASPDVLSFSPSSDTRPQSVSFSNQSGSMEALNNLLNNSDSAALQMPSFLHSSSPRHMNDFILDQIASAKDLFVNSDDTLSLPPYSCHLNDPPYHPFGVGRDLWEETEEKIKQEDSDELSNSTSVNFSVSNANNLETNNMLFPNETLMHLDASSLNSELDSFSNLC